jgi:hypothetical protein
MYDNEEGGPAIYVGKVFRARILCVDSMCEFQIEVIAPTTDVYSLASMQGYALLWKPQGVTCDVGHFAKLSIAVSLIEVLAVIEKSSWIDPKIAVS